MAQTTYIHVLLVQCWSEQIPTTPQCTEDTLAELRARGATIDRLERELYQEKDNHLEQLVAMERELALAVKERELQECRVQLAIKEVNDIQTRKEEASQRHDAMRAYFEGKIQKLEATIEQHGKRQTRRSSPAQSRRALPYTAVFRDWAPTTSQHLEQPAQQSVQGRLHPAPLQPAPQWPLPTPLPPSFPQHP
jgi:hypothetical protein